jgi:hypothetical protein
MVEVHHNKSLTEYCQLTCVINTKSICYEQVLVSILIIMSELEVLVYRSLVLMLSCARCSPFLKVMK